jgi:lysophospholipase
MTPALNRLFPAPDDPPPAGGETVVLTAADGVTLRATMWNRPGARGTVCLFPGRSEFIEKYFETVADLLNRGFAVVAIDWRGQGGSARHLSNRRKGHIDDFSVYRRDVDAVLKAISGHFPEPYLALAHSMGAAALLDAIEHGEHRFARAALSAPMTGLFGISLTGREATAVRILNLIGLGGMFLPGQQRHVASAFAAFDGNPLTSDLRRYERNARILIGAPDLAVGAPTISWTAAAFRLMRTMQRPGYGKRMRVPLLIIAAGEDTIVSTPAAESLAARIRGADCITIPGARHELLMEQDRYRTQVWAALDRFFPSH